MSRWLCWLGVAGAVVVAVGVVVARTRAPLVSAARLALRVLVAPAGPLALAH